MTISEFGDTSVYQNGQGKPQEAQGITLIAGKANWTAADAPLTRPANTTGYAAHNSMGSSSSCLYTFTNLFSFVGAQGLLTGLKLVMGATSVPASIAIRAHLFNDDLSASVLAANNDQSTFKTLLASEGAKLGYVDFSSFAIGGSGSDCIESYGTPSVSPLHLAAKATSRNLYAILEATASFTPPSASEMRLYASIAGL